jgi:hypothetical protein
MAIRSETFSRARGTEISVFPNVPVSVRTRLPCPTTAVKSLPSECGTTDIARARQSRVKLAANHLLDQSASRRLSDERAPLCTVESRPGISRLGFLIERHAMLAPRSGDQRCTPSSDAS